MIKNYYNTFKHNFKITDIKKKTCSIYNSVTFPRKKFHYIKVYYPNFECDLCSRK